MQLKNRMDSMDLTVSGAMHLTELDLEKPGIEILKMIEDCVIHCNGVSGFTCLEYGVTKDLSFKHPRGYGCFILRFSGVIKDIRLNNRMVFSGVDPNKKDEVNL